MNMVICWELNFVVVICSHFLRIGFFLYYDNNTWKWLDMTIWLCVFYPVKKEGKNATDKTGVYTVYFVKIANPIDTMISFIQIIALSIANQFNLKLNCETQLVNDTREEIKKKQIRKQFENSILNKFDI